jgi:hypothetical protein
MTMKLQLALSIVLLAALTACASPALGSTPATPPVPGAQPPGEPPANPADAAYLPNPQMTPGDTLDVTTSDICVPGYASKVRDVPTSVKNQVYREYGIASHQPRQYEVDHLISLELGGSNSIRNLWPESYTGNWNAHIKDKLENKLHQDVCAGQVDLKTAQHAIATDWIAAYKKYVGQ